MAQVRPDSAETRRLLAAADGGDRTAVGRLLARHRASLLDFVRARLDPRVAARVDASDVVQEAQMELARRMDNYLRRRPMPFHLWARKVAYQRLLNLTRDHRQTARRSVDREVPLPAASSVQVAQPLLARGPSPSDAAEASELAERVGRAVAGLAEADRDVLLMRHAEGMTYDEVACLLDVTAEAARKRYGRALIRLQRALREQGLLE